MTFTTRFAPSPTGPLHLGHAYSALLAFDMAKAAGGNFLLRIEDIDSSRARPEWEAQIYDDLHWLGLSWPANVVRQSTRSVAYRTALEQLGEMGLLFNCYCTRSDIQNAASAPQEGGRPKTGPDGVIYPGTCRSGAGKSPDGQQPPPALRLNIRAAMSKLGNNAPSFIETGAGSAQTISVTQNEALTSIGDVVLARRNMAAAYHLCVVLDDAAQGVTHVVRGEDLFEATKIHVILQKLLGHSTPTYHHHALIRDETGKRLAKRDDARALSKYRAEGATPDDIRRLTGLPVRD